MRLLTADFLRFAAIASIVSLPLVSSRGGAQAIAGRPDSSVSRTVSRSVSRSVSRLEDPGAGFTSSGSGFLVSSAGYLVTNRHVIRGCAALRVRGESGGTVAAHVVAQDSVNDLALLQADGSNWPTAVFRSGRELRAGDDVVAVGYPLNGLLADQANVTIGYVSALAGIYNDPRSIQMSAPVQPGSSGGPLFDESGTVVGVVVMKLNAKVVAEAMGDIPQNVNFAIKAKVVRSFLDAQKVSYETASDAPALSHADIGDIGKRITVLVECWK